MDAAMEESTLPTRPRKSRSPPERRVTDISALEMVKDADLEGQQEAFEKQKHTWWGTLALAYAATGIIYGDIGTSPLYVYASVFTDTPSTPDIYGAASCIFWMISLIVVVKYMLIVIMINDHGEGGTFALYTLLARHLGIAYSSLSSVHSSDTVELQRMDSQRVLLPTPTGLRSLLTSPWARKSAEACRQVVKKSRALQTCLVVLVLLMTSMVLGDGVLTPAVSVLGAVYGLQVKIPDISQGVIVLVSCIIIVLLFAGQRFGTSRVGVLFAPIVLLWFTANIIIAIYNISKYDAGIFRVLSPHYAFEYFMRNGHVGYESLAGLFLAVTGAEATYADLGHFSPAAVRLSFLCVAYPSLVITYLGQAAWLTQHADQYGSTFYASIPGGTPVFWVVFAIATATAVVASQALITGAFSLIRQSVRLGCFPPVGIFHTSSKVEGQIYIPQANYVMMALTVIVVVIFKDAVSLGYAYGIAVNMVMLGTTLLVAFTMVVVWELHTPLALLFLAVFGALESVLLSTQLKKVPHGGWFSLTIGVVVASFSYLWYWGNCVKRDRLLQMKMPLHDLLSMVRLEEEDYDELPTGHVPNASNGAAAHPGVSTTGAGEGGAEVVSKSGRVEVDKNEGSQRSRRGGSEIQIMPPPSPEDVWSDAPLIEDQHTVRLMSSIKGVPIPRPLGVALIYSETVIAAPPVMPFLLNRWGVLHKTVVFITIRTLPIPNIPDESRILMARLPYPGLFRCVARYGYMDHVDNGPAFLRQLHQKIISLDPAQTDMELDSTSVIHIFGRTQVLVRKSSNYFKKLALESGYGTLSRLVSQPWEQWNVPFDSLCEIGLTFEV